MKGIQAGLIPYQPLEDAANILLNALLTTQERADAETRLARQFRQELSDVQWSSTQPEARAWIDTILVLETAADLGDRDEMVIYGITAKPDELAGAGIAAFAGFFDQRFREHDYNLGRQHAQDFFDKLK